MLGAKNYETASNFFSKLCLEYSGLFFSRTRCIVCCVVVHRGFGKLHDSDDTTDTTDFCPRQLCYALAIYVETGVIDFLAFLAL